MNPVIPQLHQQIINSSCVSTDTRSIIPGSAFFALKGENFDANHFALQAIEKGASLAVVDNQALPDNDKLIKVNDVLEALQQVALYHRNLFNIPVIGITGSNGKTTTKELLNAVLSAKYPVLCTQGNLNNHIGVPLTLLQIRKSHKIAIIEMGANHVGEINALSQLARPTAGLITNIGKAHIEGFGSFENVITAKTELYRFLQSTNGRIFINQDNEILKKHVNLTECVTYGGGSGKHYNGKINSLSPYLSVTWNESVTSDTEKYQKPVRSKLTGAYNFENIMAAIAVGRHFNVEKNIVHKAIEGYQPTNNRSQLKKTDKNTLILDAYNANPTSMKAALENFIQLDTGQPKGLILGDMLELGNTSEEEHRSVIDYIHQSPYSFIILVGKEFSKAATGKNNILFYENVVQAGQWLAKSTPENHLILIKGSRGIQLEKLYNFL